MHTQIQIYVCMYVCICVCTCVYVDRCLHTYMGTDKQKPALDKTNAEMDMNKSEFIWIDR